MEVLNDLISDFLSPALLPLGFSLDLDDVFRKWSEDKGICALVQIRGQDNRYSMSIGFCAPIIVTWFELPPTDCPTMPHCNTCGIIIIKVDDETPQKIRQGFRVTSKQELEKVGSLFRDALVSRLPGFLEQFMTMNGWVAHFRNEIVKFSRGRGIYWSMLGYSLLARPETTLSEIRDVIEAHSYQDGSGRFHNRVDRHLEKQRKLVYERFGVRI